MVTRLSPGNVENVICSLHSPNQTCWFELGGNPGLVVMGGGLCSIGHGFESRRHILDRHNIFSHIFVVRIVMFVWKDDNKQKRGRGWKIKKIEKNMLIWLYVIYGVRICRGCQLLPVNGYLAKYLTFWMSRCQFIYDNSLRCTVFVLLM